MSRTNFHDPEDVRATEVRLYAPNEDSDQPAHPRSLISLRCPPEGALDP